MVIKEAYSFVEKEALFNNVKVEMDLDDSLNPIWSDRTQLQQVFLNLMDNALDAVEQGGKVTVTSTANASNLSGPGQRQRPGRAG